MKFIWDKRVIGVVNTHIRWSSPDKPIEEHKRYCQVKELIECHLSDEEVEDWIICGDFNAEEETEVIQQIKRAGFIDEYEQMKGATISKDGLARIDFIFYTKGLEAHPDLIEPLTENSLLPSKTQPSDHLAISAVFFNRT